MKSFFNMKKNHIYTGILTLNKLITNTQGFKYLLLNKLNPNVVRHNIFRAEQYNKSSILKYKIFTTVELANNSNILKNKNIF